MTFAEGLNSIGTFVFEGCTGLTSVTFAEGLASTKSGHSKGAQGSLGDLAEGLTSIGKYAFSDAMG